MDAVKEIGGYFSLEKGKDSYEFKNGVYLNSARNALAYIVRLYSIREIYVPYYTCPVLWTILENEHVILHFYDLNMLFLPSCDIPAEAFVLYTNYFGICANNVRKMGKKFKNLIVDNAQAFYSPPSGLASLYSPRKFFGLPDGGVAVCDGRLACSFDTDISYTRCMHLLKRVDSGAAAAHEEFKNNEDVLEGQPVKYMSRLTRHMMHTVDYAYARRRRIENFMYLHRRFAAVNTLRMKSFEDAVPLAYPLAVNDPELRGKFIKNRIYVPTYWKGVEEKAPRGSYAAYLSKGILPLPVDQRYGKDDMERIVRVFFS